MSDQSLDTVRSGMRPSHTASAWRAGMLTAVLAVVLALVVLGVALLAGADMKVQPSGGRESMAVGVVPVVVTVLLAVTLGTALLAVLSRRGAKWWRTLAVAGLVIGVVSVVIPLTATADVGTKLALAAMHVVAGAVWYVVLTRMTRV